MILDFHHRTQQAEAYKIRDYDFGVQFPSKRLKQMNLIAQIKHGDSVGSSSTDPPP